MSCLLTGVLLTVTMFLWNDVHKIVFLVTKVCCWLYGVRLGCGLVLGWRNWTQARCSKTKLAIVTCRCKFLKKFASSESVLCRASLRLLCMIFYKITMLFKYFATCTGEFQLEKDFRSVNWVALLVAPPGKNNSRPARGRGIHAAMNEITVIASL